jgi:hypothetical protein
MSITIANNNKGLEPGSLTGSGLFLNWGDFHHLIFQSRANESVDDLILLDG